MHPRLFTPVPLSPLPWKISYGSELLFLGSCFAESIGNRFAERKFKTLINPFGILYNPASLATALRRMVENRPYRESDLFFSDSLYHSLDHHGSFSGSDKQEVLTRINQKLSVAHDTLARASYLFITPGTARVYRHRESGRIAGNCHKLPSGHFDTECLSTEESYSLLSDALDGVLALNSRIKLIFTLSPVRYIKNGAHQSQIEKATLLLALNRLSDRYREQSFYFPAYEIMLDELRDYRFYAEDMVHPSETAISYLFEKVEEVMTDEESSALSRQILSVVAASRHRLLHPTANAVASFAQKQLDNIASLTPHCTRFGVSLAEEERYFRTLLPLPGQSAPDCVASRHNRSEPQGFL